jgi:hypothetical protein
MNVGRLAVVYQLSSFMVTGLEETNVLSHRLILYDIPYFPESLVRHQLGMNTTLHTNVTSGLSSILLFWQWRSATEVPRDFRAVRVYSYRDGLMEESGGHRLG